MGNGNGVLTSCGHFMCDKHQIGDNQKCPICQSICGVIKLDGVIPSEILQFFDTPEDIIEKAVAILKFQNQQKEILIRHYEESISSMEETIRELTEENRKLQYKDQDVKSVCLIPQIIHKTPSNQIVKEPSKLFTPTLATKLQNLTGKKLYE